MPPTEKKPIEKPTKKPTNPNPCHHLTHDTPIHLSKPIT